MSGRKFQIPKSKLQTTGEKMEKGESGDNAKPYDLGERTFLFAQEVRTLVKRLDRTIGNIEDARQVVRSSGSVGANYIEANEALSKKDFVMRIKICRKEAKESGFFLRLLDIGSDPFERMRAALVQESSELVSIFTAILRKSE
jgi:four helix bundle protein